MYVCVYVYVGACIYVSVWVHCMCVCMCVFPGLRSEDNFQDLVLVFYHVVLGIECRSPVKCHNPLSYLSSPKSICFVVVVVCVCVVVSCVSCRSRYNCWEPLFSFYLGFQRLNLGCRA